MLFCIQFPLNVTRVQFMYLYGCLLIDKLYHFASLASFHLLKVAMGLPLHRIKDIRVLFGESQWGESMIDFEVLVSLFKL